MSQKKSDVAIIIPIRMGSTRLPGKFHAQILGKPMIAYVLEQALIADIGPVYVACDDIFHVQLVESHGGKAILTDVAHQSGTDRVCEAINIVDPGHHIKYIVNLQDDVPFIKPESIKEAYEIVKNDENVAIGTLATKIYDPEQITSKNVVKIALAHNLQALYFSREAIPHNADIYYHHIGIYSFKREALEKFVSLPQSGLEKLEKLEQLRALENGMRIDVKIVNELPLSVDVPEDLLVASEYALKLKKSIH